MKLDRRFGKEIVHNLYEQLDILEDKKFDYIKDFNLEELTVVVEIMLASFTRAIKYQFDNFLPITLPHIAKLAVKDLQKIFINKANSWAKKRGYQAYRLLPSKLQYECRMEVQDNMKSIERNKAIRKELEKKKDPIVLKSFKIIK